MKLWESGKRKHKDQPEEFQEAVDKYSGNMEDGDTKVKRLGKILKGIGRRIGGMIRRHRILTVLLALLLIAAIVAAAVWQNRSRRPQQEPVMTVETATVERMDLSNSIGVTGTLATAEGKSGTTTLENIEVTEVFVELGDEVQEGDVICTFDSSDIESALADARNNYSVNQQLDALDNYETEYTETVEDAENSLEEARATRDAYKIAYEEAVSAEEEALNALNEVESQYAVEELKSAYDSAASALKSALEEELRTSSGTSGESTENPEDTGTESTETAEDTAESGGTEDSGSAASSGGYQILDLESYLSSVTAIPDSCSAAYETYTAAKSAYEAAEKAISDAQTAYEQAQANTSSAYSAYEQAQSQKESVQEQYDSTIEQAQETYEQAQLQEQLVTEDDALNQIESYEEQLEDCTVYAAMSGTITELNVEAGGVFTGGTIYEIQDVHNFIVEATVDEYDVVDIEEGQTAYIVTDSLGDEELEGEVTYVAAVGTSGQTMGSASGTASYEVQITINEPQDKLRSGMTASVSIALEESKDTLAVPYDCVQTNEAGESVIYVDDNGERKEVTVETGIETDYYIEVSSDEISEGMTVYLSTPLVQSGSGTENASDGEEAVTFDFGGDMGGGGGMPSGGGPSGGGGGMGGF